MSGLPENERVLLERIRKQPQSELAWAYRLGRKTAMFDIAESIRKQSLKAVRGVEAER